MANLDYIQAAVMLGKPPNNDLRVWLNHRCTANKPALRVQPRLVNGFKLGADPEFIFEDTYRARRVDATALNLRPGVFIGADQNGRLVEVRPEPSASALRVVGSIMASLRLLGPLFPHCRALTWKAGAWLYDDGVGGHIHFGRKRPTRPAEIAALDGLANVLYGLRIFPMDQQERRMRGDKYHQIYGQPSDYRLQVHGYEYRSLPSWLDSPWLAYLCITLSKLAVANPDLVAPWQDIKVPTVDHIRYLLAYFKGIDDDAALCLYALEKLGMPVWYGDDFKTRWGADNPQLLEHTSINVYPNTVSAGEGELKDLFNYFSEKVPIPNRQAVVGWTPTHLPEGYELMTNVVEFRGQVGMGELFGNVVRHAKTVPIAAAATNKGKAGLLITDSLVKLMDKNWREQIKEIAPGLSVHVIPAPDKNYTLYVHKKWRQGKRFSTMRKVLTCGLFPLWRVKDVDPTRLGAWQHKAAGARKARPKLKGKVLYPAAKENG